MRRYIIICDKHNTYFYYFVIFTIKLPDMEPGIYRKKRQIEKTKRKGTAVKAVPYRDKPGKTV